MRRILLTTSAGVALLCVVPASAQQTAGSRQARAREVAEQCLADLQT